MPPQALTTTYPTRINTFNTGLITQIIQPTLSTSNLVPTPASRTTKRGTQIINYAEEDDDDFEHPADRDINPRGGVTLVLSSNLSSNPSALPSSSGPNNVLSSIAGYDVSIDGIQKPIDLPGKEVRRPPSIPHRTEDQLLNASLLSEVLIPIRLDIDIDSTRRLKDSFLWNLNETLITPDQFALTMCQDLDLPPHTFATQISTSIRSQIEEYAPVATLPLPAETDFRVIIKLEISLRKFLYQDKFEWDIANTQLTPEVFAKGVCADLGLAGEFLPAISTAIYESALGSKKQIVENGGQIAPAITTTSDGSVVGTATSITNTVENDCAFGAEAGWRIDQEGLGIAWAPSVDILSREDMEKREGDRERQIRRLRRETARFAGGGGGGGGGLGGAVFGDLGGGDENMGRGERKKRKRNRSLSPPGGMRGSPMQNGGGGSSRVGGGGSGGVATPTSLADWERPNWKCTWCALPGSSAWGVRDGPFGPKSLCPTCSTTYHQQGILPEWLKGLHVVKGPAGTAGVA